MKHWFTPMLALSVIAPIALIANVDAQCVINVTVPDDTVYVFEGSQSSSTIVVNDIPCDGVLSFRSSNNAKFTVVDADAATSLNASITGDLPRNVTVMIEGRAISLESLVVVFKSPGAEEMELGRQTIGVRRVPKLIQALYIYIVLAFIVLSYLSMGGSMDPKEIWHHVRRPYGILIALLCQFIIMPAMTYIIALLVADGDDAVSVGIVLIGTAPGGWLSNIFCALLDVDLVLSITMTFFSTLIALGMMPLNLFFYATPFTTENSRLRTPFLDLVQQLAILVIPLFVGIAITWKFPKFKNFCKKVVKPIAILLIILGIAMGVPADLYAFTQSPVNLWVAGIVIPAFGGFFGLSFARIFARDIRTSITIAIETGVQNSLLARTIIFLFYPQPEADLLARVALIAILITIIEGCIAVSFYYLFRYLLCKRRCEKMHAKNELEDEKVIAGDEIKTTAIDSKDDPGTASPPAENGAQNTAYQSDELEMPL